MHPGTYTHMHRYTCAHMDARVCTQAQVCTHAQARTRTCINMYTYRHTVCTYHRYTRVHIETQVHACAHRYTHMHTHSHAQMHVFPQVRLILWASTRRPLPTCRSAAPQHRPPGSAGAAHRDDACSPSGRPRSDTQHTCIPISPKPVMSLEKAAVDEKVI